MDDTAKALQDRLRERRKVMSMTMHTTASSQNIETPKDDDTDDENAVTELVQEDVENIHDSGDDAMSSRLKEKLESRHDATRKRLQKSEIHARPEVSPHSKPQLDIPPVVPSISMGPTQEMASPRSEIESTLGRSTGAKSLRSRLQEKLQAAKQQRSMSPMTEERKRTQRLKDRISSSTRFDDPLRTLSRPELEKEKELESKVAAKLRWRKAVQKTRQETGLPNESECYDFFTKQFEEVPQETEQSVDEEVTEPEEPRQEEVARSTSHINDGPLEPAEEGREIVEEAHEAEETEEDTKKLLSEVIPEELDWKLVNITSAEYPGYRICLQNETKVNYVPSLMDAPAESKVVQDAPPVYLEEEGFYVGLMPEVQIRNRNILENRILSQEHLDPKSWFGQDGRVKMLPNPVKTTPTNPWVAGLQEMDPAIETIYVKAYESSVEEKYLQDVDEYELQIDTGTVVFHHHPLMSREHVLASSMSEMYEEYIRHRQKNYEVFFNEKLRTLRLALRTMKRNASKAEGHEDLPALSGQELRIQDYLTEIRRTCRQRDRAEAYERELMKKIISEWKEIEQLRTVQVFYNTSVKLTVKKQEVNKEEDRKQWQKEIDLQLEESAEEYNYNVQYPYRKQMTQYQSDLQEWKKKKMKLKRQQKRSAGLAEESEAQSTDEDVVGVNPKPLKPLPPAKFDEIAQRNALITLAMQSRRNPGEPRISLEVTNTGTITPNHHVPDGEAARRRALQNSAMIARIVFNGREVCSSEKKSITSDFRVHFGQIFKIVISQWPDSVKVQLLEAGRLSNTVLNEINLRIPDGSVNSENAQLFPTDFSSDKIVSYPSHEGVGSSTPFTLRSDTTAPISLKTRGQLFVSISWGLNEEGNVLAPKLLSHLVGDSLEGEGRPQARSHRSQAQNDLPFQDSDIRALWSQEGRLDPNDPANSGLLTFTNNKEGFAPAMDYFRLDQLQQQFNFVSDEDMANARRFKILEYRAKGVAEFRNVSMVPANEHEILDSAFTAYERRKREKDALGEIAERKVAAGTLSSHRLEVLRFRQRVRDSVLRRFYAARHFRTLQDMVHEDEVPDIGTLGINILKAVEPRRPLKPVRIERKKATAQNLTEGSVKILVAVVRAYNLPTRDRTPLTGLEGSLSRQVFGATIPQQQQKDDETYKLSPFVSVSFQSNVKTTSVAQGPNPSWNEELELPFSAPNNDYNPESLQTVDDTLFIHVFDRVVMDANIDNRDRNEIGETSGAATGIVSHRIQNHWLGSLKVPFATIYQQAKIDGTFKLNVPVMMLGYSAEKGDKEDPNQDVNQRATSADPYDQMNSQFLQPQEGSYLTVFVTLEPELSRPEPIPQKFETQEDQHLINESLKFIEECKKKFPKRRVKATVIDINGESVFITRYIKPLPPPPSLVEGSSQNSQITAERLARFVSLIPFVSDNVIYAGTCDLWSTCDQFLNMLCGDEEEHAIMLVNYFLHIGKQAYLVLGNAIPEGETAYVLTLEMSQEYLLWNASTGQHYKTKDALCPLQSVHALVNQDNIWFNMQAHESPARLSFNPNSSGWKPLFRSTTVARGLPSVQPDSLVYPEADLVYVQNLEERIERSLKDSIMNWRPRHVTRWNRSCSSSLRQILQGLESERWRITPTDEASSSLRDQEDHAERLRRLIGGARFVGFPMDMPFTDIDSVIKTVRSTEVHKIQDSDIEFALAVFIHSYPASVLCVWVYIAALNSRKPY